MIRFGLVGAAGFIANRRGAGISVFFIRASFVLLLVIFTAMSDAPTPKPGEATVAATVAATAAPAAAPRSVASSSGGTTPDAHLAGAESDYVRAADMAQWMGQVERQLGLVRENGYSQDSIAGDAFVSIVSTYRGWRPLAAVAPCCCCCCCCCRCCFL